MTEEFSFPPRKKRGGLNFTRSLKSVRSLSIKPEVVGKFQATANVQFQLKEGQVTAVKSLLLNHDALAVLPTGYGKSLIFQSFVVAKELLNSAKACVLVICPLTH